VPSLTQNASEARPEMKPIVEDALTNRRVSTARVHLLPIFVIVPSRCSDLSSSVIRRTKSVRVFASFSGSSRLSRIASAAMSVAETITPPYTAS
jgi:hypothetical protein